MRPNKALRSLPRLQNPWSKARAKRARVRDLQMKQVLRPALRLWDLSNRAKVSKKARDSRMNPVPRRLRVLPNPLNKVKLRKKGRVNTANRRLVLAAQ